MTIEEHGAELAQHIAAALKDHPHAEVRVNPNIQAAIPPNIASNLLEFLRRVQSTAWKRWRGWKPISTYSST